MKVNRQAIKRHLEFLFEGLDDYEDGMIEISILNDSANFKYSDIDKAIDQAVSWNENGKNIYTVGSLMLPDIAPFGRNSDKDFYATNVLWCDIDEPVDLTYLKEKYKECPPSFVTVTGRVPHTRMHLWWKLDEPITDPAELRSAIIGIQQNLGGDPSAKNPSRLMRIAGSISYPTKNGRIQELTEANIPKNSGVVNIENVIRNYPIIQERTKPLIESHSHKLKLMEGWSETDVRILLNYINPDCSYDEWFQIGMAVKDYGLPFSVWDEWSMKGGKYEESHMVSKWNSFNGSGVTIGTLIHKAKENGWVPAEKKEDRKPDIERANALIKSEYQFDPETGEIIEDNASPIVSGQKGLFYIKAADIKANIDNNHFVQDLMSDGALSVVYGESNCGKTFFMTDLAFHVAMGKQWRDKRVEQGGVVYAALEGSHGLANRVAAFKQHYGEIPQNFAMVPCQIDFMDKEGNIDAFIDLLNVASNDIGRIRLVVIDTLARAMAGGDENSGEDMSMLVHHADMIKGITGAHVCFIHHSGKDRAKGARGHSSLRAAVDTEIEISREQDANFSAVKVVKQRDMQMADEMYFSLEPIILGQNQYEENVTSCVVMPYENSLVDKKPRVARLTDMQKFVYDSIVSALSDGAKDVFVGAENGNKMVITYDQLTEKLMRRGFKDMFNKSGENQVKSSTQTARIALKEKGYVNFTGNYIWIDHEVEDV